MPLNDGYSYREQLGPRAHGQRALWYLIGKYRHSSAQDWRERIARGEVHLDGTPINGHEILQAGQILVWHRPPWEEEETPRDYDLVYKDDALLAVIKPSGLPTMHGGGFLENTLLSLVRAQYPEASPLHRLGRTTTGLVLFARTHDAASKLTEAWRNHEVEKRYRALGSGVATQDRAVIDAPIGPVPHPRIDTVHGVSAAGKPARSVAAVLERREDTTLFAVDIQTGRPHQIRIHLAFLGHPLVGDPLYAAGGRPRTPNPGLPGDGGYLLHAERLAFTHPLTGERLELHAPPPPELRRAGE